MIRLIFAITTTVTTVLLLFVAIYIQTPWYFSSPLISNPDVKFSTFKLDSHSLRVKKSNTCHGTQQVNNKHSGYLDNLKTDDHLFFIFFESSLRSTTVMKKETGPLVLWLNGGPGCSSFTSAMSELGPCVVNSNNGITKNPYSWNTNSNIVFVDQPANTGYSHGSYRVKNSKEAAHDIFIFLQLFFIAFPELSKSQLHVAGESFAGHYIPAVAAEILLQNRRGHFSPLNLDSLLIGNGWVDPRTQLRYYESFGCANDSSFKPIFDNVTCKKMQTTSRNCQKLMDTCYKYQNSITCVPAGLYCQQTQLGPYVATGRNNFDIRIPCHKDSELCYNVTDHVNAWANRQDIRQDLGIDLNKDGFTTCNENVGYRFALSGDMTISYAPQVAEALDSGIRVLIYAGDMDFSCNWYGNLAWTIELPWSGHLGYSKSRDLNWYSTTTGKLAGQIRQYKNLTFLKVNNAGHWVPYDQPEHAMELFNIWIENRLFVEKSD